MTHKSSLRAKRLFIFLALSLFTKGALVDYMQMNGVYLTNSVNYFYFSEANVFDNDAQSIYTPDIHSSS